jgi:hypothetical protein
VKFVRHLDSPAVAALVSVVAYAVFVVNMLEARKGDISHFVIAGFVDEKEIPPGLTVLPNAYDGVAFYRFAVNPFTRVPKQYGIHLDNPPYRHQRIGYPLIVWALSFGDPRSIPRLLVGVNLAAMTIMGAVGAMLAQHYGYHALLGLIFPAFPGFMISISRDLSEIVAATCILATILAVEKRRFGWAAVFLSYAVLTRETAVIVVCALGAAYVFDRLHRRERRIAPIAFIVPASVFVVWQSILWMIWGSPGVKAGAPQWTVPFVEYWRFLRAALPRRVHLERVYVLECALLALLVVLTLLVWRRSRAGIEWRIGWAGALLLVSTLPHGSWLDDFGFLRIMADLALPSCVLILGSPSPLARWFTFAVMVWTWHYLSGHFVLMG